MTAIKYALLTILALLLFGTGVERCYALNDIEGLEAFLSTPDSLAFIINSLIEIYA